MFINNNFTVSVFAKLQSTDETERLVISRMLRHTTVNFIWATSENIDWNNLSKTTLVSRFPRVYFTTKVSIFCECSMIFLLNFLNKKNRGVW